MLIDEYFLSYEDWEEYGKPDLAPFDHIEDPEVGGFFLINIPDNDNNGLPDFLENIGGDGDVILRPSQGVVVG